MIVQEGHHTLMVFGHVGALKMNIILLRPQWRRYHQHVIKGEIRWSKVISGYFVQQIVLFLLYHHSCVDFRRTSWAGRYRKKCEGWWGQCPLLHAPHQLLSTSVLFKSFQIVCNKEALTHINPHSFYAQSENSKFGKNGKLDFLRLFQIIFK